MAVSMKLHDGHVVLLEEELVTRCQTAANGYTSMFHAQRAPVVTVHLLSMCPCTGAPDPTFGRDAATDRAQA